MQEKIITISRQCGSGGHSIGSELANRLDVPFYDKEIIEMAAKESGFHKEFIEEKGEHMNNSLLFNIARYASYGGRRRYEEYQPLQDQIYFAQVKIIKELAGKGPCVIVGRCADYVLRDRNDVLNVFIHADMAFKKKRCMERGQFSDEKADDMIRRRDKLRADHYQYYTDQKWGDSLNYHLCLDSGIFSIEKCVSMIEDASKGMGSPFWKQE
jgi:cytidylate kinase